MPRMFVALDLPEETRVELARIQGGIQGARWVPPENFHVTLRFIGEISNRQVDDIIEALSGIEADSLELGLSSVGCFQSRGRVRSVWTRVEPDGALTAVQRKVAHAVAAAGHQAKERRFHPHVTLARFRDAPPERLREFLASRALFRSGPFTVDALTLFESLTGHGGAVYRPVCDVALGIR